MESARKKIQVSLNEMVFDVVFYRLRTSWDIRDKKVARRNVFLEGLMKYEKLHTVSVQMSRKNIKNRKISFEIPSKEIREKYENKFEEERFF